MPLLRLGFLSDTAVLLAGTVVAQAIAFGFSVLLARFYGDQAFGYYAVFLSGLGIAGILSTGAYDKAIVFSSSRRRYEALVSIVLGLATLLAAAMLAVALAVWLAGFVAGRPFLSAERLGLAAALAIATFAHASTQVFVFSALRSARAVDLSATKVLQSTLTGASQTSLSLVTASAGLIWGHVLGQLVFAVRATRIALRILARWSIWNVRAVRSTARKHVRYPLYVCPNELLDVVSAQLPLLLIGALFSVGTLGQYAFAQRMLSAPSAVLGQAVGQSFLKGIASDAVSARETRQLMVRVWIAMFAVGVVPFGAVLLFGPRGFALVFGDQWTPAGAIAAASVPLLLARFVSSPTSVIAYRLGMQRTQLVLSVMVALVRAVPVFAALGGASLIQVIVMQTLGELAVIVAFNWRALRQLRLSGAPVRMSGNGEVG